MIRDLEDITLVIDGAIFQLQKGKPFGISKFWATLLEELDQNNIFKKVVLFDRGYCPEHKNIEHVTRDPLDFSNVEAVNKENLQINDYMKETNATVFISTYYTSSSKSFSISYLYDFIPEKLGQNLNEPQWINKYRSMQSAKSFIGISNTTLSDLTELYPEFSHRLCSLVYISVNTAFKKYSEVEVNSLLQKLNITSPYFVISGNRLTYKNILLFIKGLAYLKTDKKLTVVFVGGYKSPEYVFTKYFKNLDNINFINAALSDEDLSTLLNGALCSIYPSLYEGFGMPILEGFASHCPVLISKSATACLEIAGEYSYKVDPHNVSEMAKTLKEIIEHNPLTSKVQENVERAKSFNMDQTLGQFASAIRDNIPAINNYYGYTNN